MNMKIFDNKERYLNLLIRGDLNSPSCHFPNSNNIQSKTLKQQITSRCQMASLLEVNINELHKYNDF